MVNYIDDPKTKETAVKPVRISWPCPKECGGEMVFIGDLKRTDPPRYKHQCDKCGHMAITSSEYPRIEYK